jgi:NhaP-type Na+/H+ or K+/H+ antiporter
MPGTDLALLTVVWATGAGLLAQLLAHRLRIPAIVPLLAVGVLLGPSGLDVVQPATLGSGLPVIVKLAVAVILFDGALNLRLGDLRHAIAEVRNLVTIGVLVTWVGATLASRFLAQLSWPVAIIFGAVVTVTGPTVVQPLLRRVQLPRRLKTTLEGEAILIDPIGAILAVAVVDVVLGVAGVRPIGFLGGAWAYVGRLFVGAVVGAVGALILTWLLKRPRLVPPELVNIVALAGAWVAFGAAEWSHGESGITAAVVMGLALQRGAVPDERRLRRFKEQLTLLGISLIFVLLAAALPLSVLRAEGSRALWTVVVLMVVVRPVGVGLSLRHSTLSWREKVFAAWIAPRGIVAASVASLFALELAEAGFVEGPRLLALTFLTIAATVTLHGLSAAPLARLLRLQSLEGKRAIVIGAGPLGRALADAFRRRGRPVGLVDRNAFLVSRARAEGFDAVEGNALDESTLDQAGAEEAESLVAVTTNSEVNALAAHLAHDAFGIGRAYPALADAKRGAGPRLLDRVGGVIAFARAVDVRTWEYDLERGDASLMSQAVPSTWVGKSIEETSLPGDVVPLIRIHAGSVEIVNSQQSWQRGDEIIVMTRLSAEETSALLDTPVGVAGPDEAAKP